MAISPPDSTSTLSEQGAVRRAEKMGLLSAMLGPEAMARIRSNQPDLAARAEVPAETQDPDRVAWHRNRLLERLRLQGNPLAGAAQGQARKPRPVDGQFRTRLDLRGTDAKINALAEPGHLEDEHPAVISRLMTGMQQADRVAALKTLSGPLARAVVRRMR